MALKASPTVNQAASEQQQSIKKIFAAQRVYATSHLRHSKAKDRIRKLKKLKDWIWKHRADIQKALHQDLRKTSQEADLAEIYPVLSEIRHAIQHVRQWMRPQSVETPFTLWGTRSYMQYEPKGNSLIISPWNFPFSLTLGPIVSAIAAGCTAMIKPSEMSAATSDLIVRLVAENFEEQEFAVFLGDKDTSTALLAQPFDHIFFTGSTFVGGIVMQAAAKHLSSVTLELGGKSPAIIDETAAIKDAGLKLAWGKLLNGGQACVAPDYALVHESQLQAFLEAFKAGLDKVYSSDPKQLQQNGGVCRIITDRHFERLTDLIEEAVAKGAEVFLGGEADPEDRFIPPTVLLNVPADAKVMQEEIFGPILPVITYKTLEEALDFVNARENPLAFYFFSRSGKNQEQALKASSAGTTVINDNFLQFVHPELPFGGVTHSGFGKGHGFWGFEAFSNLRPVVKSNTWVTSPQFVYPPFNKFKTRMIELILRYF